MTDAISVVIPAFNSARYIAEAVASIMAQTLAADAIIIVDDGSSDDTASVVRGLDGPVRYQRQDHAGAAAARNAGVAAVETEYLAFLDSDDLWLPEKLAWQAAALSATDAPDMAFGHTEQFVSPDLPADHAATFVFKPGPMPAVMASALLIPTAQFRRVGPFCANLETGEFIEWYARAVALGLRSRVLPQTVVRRRLHAGNHGRTADPIQYARAMKAVLDNRRKSR